jgi:hypothetical protein
MSDARQITGRTVREILAKARKQHGWRRAYTKTRWVDGVHTCFAVFGSLSARVNDHAGAETEHVYAVVPNERMAERAAFAKAGHMHLRTTAQHAY